MSPNGISEDAQTTDLELLKLEELIKKIAEKLNDDDSDYYKYHTFNADLNTLKIRISYIKAVDISRITQLFYDNNCVEALVNVIDIFDKSQHQKIAEEIIKRKVGYILINYLEKFTISDYNTLARLLIDKNNGLDNLPDWNYTIFLENLHKFKDLDKDIAKFIWSDTNGPNVSLNSLYNFDNLDYDLAILLIHKNEGFFVAKYFEKFTLIPEEEHIKIVNEILKYDKDPTAVVSLIHNFYKFKNISSSEQMSIIKEITRKDPKLYSVIVKNLKNFYNIQTDEKKELIKLLLEFEYPIIGGLNLILENLDIFDTTVRDEEINNYILKSGFKLKEVIKYNSLHSEVCS